MISIDYAEGLNASELNFKAGVCETPDQTDQKTIRQRPPRKVVIDHEYKSHHNKDSALFRARLDARALCIKQIICGCEGGKINLDPFAHFPSCPFRKKIAKCTITEPAIPDRIHGGCSLGVATNG